MKIQTKTLYINCFRAVMLSFLAATFPAFSASFDLERLTGYVWSSNCDDAGTIATLWTKDTQGLTKQTFLNNRRFLESKISSVDASGQNTLNFSSTTGSETETEFIEFSEDQYRVIDKAINGRQVIKYGMNQTTLKESPYHKRCPKGSAAYVEVANLTQTNQQRANNINQTVNTGQKTLNQTNQAPPSIQPTKGHNPEVERLGRQALSAAERGDYKKACALGKQLQSVAGGMSSEFINSTNAFVDNQCAIQKGLNAFDNLTKTANCPAYRAANYQCGPAANPEACIRRIFPQYNPAIHQYCP